MPSPPPRRFDASAVTTARPPGVSVHRRRDVLQASAAAVALGAFGQPAAAAIPVDARPGDASPAATRIRTDPTSKETRMFAYVGSRTTRERNARGEGITVYAVDPRDGALAPVQVVRDLVNPSYLALSGDGRTLYTVHGDASEVSAFRVDRATGTLALLNRQDTRGRNPVHLAIAPSGRFLVVSNHLGGGLVVLPIDADGALGPVSQQLALEGPLGPHRIEQKQSKPHFNPFDPTGRHVLVPDKGLDRVFVFDVDGGTLRPSATPFVTTREGAGPRHLAFHPSAPFAYVVDELDSTITGYRLGADRFGLEPLQILPTLPDTYTGDSRAAGIAVDAAGRTLYASNRGHDSLAIFRIDAATGRLAFLGAEPSGGRTPRFFTLAPGGRFLYALNEESDSIVRFAVDPADGRLARSGAPVATGSPVCMVFSA